MKTNERVEKMISEAIKREGKKSNMKIGDGREFIKILVDMEVEDAQLLLLTYEELAEVHEVVKPRDAAEKMGLKIQEVYNLIKKLRRAADRVKQRIEEKYGK